MTDSRMEMELEMLISAARNVEIPRGWHGECDNCGEQSRLVEGVCSQCRDRFDRINRRGFFK